MKRVNLYVRGLYRGLPGIHEDFLATDLQGVASHSHVRVPADFAGGHVKLPGMPRAHHHGAIQGALPQRAAPVQARAANGVKLTRHIRDGDGLALDMEFSDRARRKVPRVRRFYKGHLCSPIWNFALDDRPHPADSPALQNGSLHHFFSRVFSILRESIFQYVAGRKRWMMSICVASEPMRMRASRRSTPRRMRSAAASGVVLARRANCATASSLPSFGAFAPMRARAAIAVRIPPGWTGETLTVVPANSWRSASVKPRTANLLVE